MLGKRGIGLIILIILIVAGATGLLLYKQQLDRVYEEDVKKPYREAGLSEEQANEFIAKYPEQNGNSTWVSFAKSWAEDKALADESLKTFGSLKESLEYLYSSDSKQLLMKSLEYYGKDASSFVNFVEAKDYDGLNFLKDFPQLAKNYREVLPAYSKNPRLVKAIYDQFQRDARISSNRNELFLKGLKEYQDLNLIDKNLMVQTVQALNNLTLAYEKGLPRLDKSVEWLLTNATQVSRDIVDFEPVVVKDVVGNRIVIQSSDLARDYWMIANLLKERPALANQAEKFEWLNRMVQQIAWDIFDYEYGPKYFDGKTYSPNDSEVWQVILGFNDYMDALPAKLEKDGIGVIFPYHDSDLLRNYIADKTNRTIALFYLAELPAKTVNKTYAAELLRLAQERKITSAEYDRLYQEKAIVSGIRGVKLFVEQLPKEYEELISAKNDPTIIRYPAFSGTKAEWARLYYQQWLNDRAGHGLSNTVEQFKGIDKFLPEIVKFIYGYESFKAGDWGGEWEMYRYGLPLAFKAFGIPSGVAEHGANFGRNSDSYLDSQGAARSEWGVSLPDSIILQLRQTFPQYKIITDYANRISLLSLIDGLTKDSSGVEWVATVIRGGDIPVYLWKK